MKGMSTTFILATALCLFTNDAFADQEDRSGETEEYQETKNTSREILGPLDSHEAMNNRESIPLNPNRIKRSYEFLIGLINNNSRYEVTNIDVPPSNRTTRGEGEVTENAVTTGENLLELMVKIAAHPDQWEKVHKLLQKLDEDLEESRKLVESIKLATISNNSEIVPPHREKKAESVGEKDADVTKTTPLTTHNNPPPFLPLHQTQTPETSEEDEIQKLVVVLSGGPKKSGKNQTISALKENKWPQQQQSSTKVVSEPSTPPHTYPKSFAYHRVTGHPLHLTWDKKPKAYIAVSVIAPKPLHNRPPDEDFVLENELRQLKPWTHKQNLKNMASIRSRWVIESERKNEGV